MTAYEWAVIDAGRIIYIPEATCPADVMRETHGHGSHGPVGVARRLPGGEWGPLT